MDSFIFGLFGETATTIGFFNDNYFIIISNVSQVAVAVSAIKLTWSGTILLISPIE